MYFLKLIGRNSLRHKLRTALTTLGIVIAVLAFGLLQTVVDAWYAGANAASTTRLVTRNAISLVFPLPITYRDRIRQIAGVRSVSQANWFGGVYISERNFFPQFAVDAATYFDMYPELVVPPDQMQAFLRDRKGCIVGRKLAQTYGWRVGDVVPLRGTIHPGTWDFVIRGIYQGRDAATDEVQFFFHWQYLNESLRRSQSRLADTTGIFLIDVDDAERTAEIARAVDATFRNSLAETLTETEKAFQLGFVSMTEAIVVAIRLVSFLVIVIILAVMANTMAMAARERLAEYATLKAIGFAPGFVRRLILGESIAISLAGSALGCALTFPVAHLFASRMGTLFPVFQVSAHTVVLQLAAGLLIGVIAAVAPGIRAGRVRIAEGLRAVG